MGRACGIRSLETGKLLVDPVTLEPLRIEGYADTQELHLDQREYIISRLKPHQQTYVLRNNYDRDWHRHDFQPWTVEEDSNLDREPWYRDKEYTISIAVGHVRNGMKEHLDYLYQKVWHLP
jgi:hypothetical protein